MAKHDVSFEVPRRQLGRSDVSFRVRADGELLGTLTVSNGSIVWFLPGTSYGCKMGWARFNEMMQKCARREEKR